MFKSVWLDNFVHTISCFVSDGDNNLLSVFNTLFDQETEFSAIKNSVSYQV